MLFRGKKITEYNASDIQSLIDNKVPESRYLDYKRQIKKNEESSKTELIYDISSFFNSEGGCLIIGLDEEKDEQSKKTGIPKIPENPILLENFDELKLWIEETVRQSTNPQITKLEFSNLIEVGDTHIFLIGIPKTNTLPAMVTYSKQNRFYKRKSNGKYILDTYELFETFSQMGFLEERIKEFVVERYEEVLQNKFWPGLSSLSSVLIHIIPISNFATQIDTFSSYNLKEIFIKYMKPPGNESYSYRYCLEGFHLYCNRTFDTKYDIIPYNLIFRNGTTEAFTNEPFMVHDPNNTWLDGTKLISMIKDQVQKSFLLGKELSIDPYYYLSIKLNNVGKMSLNDNGRRVGSYPNYSELRLPGVFINGNLNEMKTQVKNVLDILWQSVGANECPSNSIDKEFDSFIY